MVKLWDAGTGAMLQTIEGHSDLVTAVAFSRDDKLLASTSSDKTVKLWDTGSGAVLQTLEGHSDLVNAVAFSRDGKLLASASDDTTVKLWDAGTGAVLQTLNIGAFIRTLSFSNDGTSLKTDRGSLPISPSFSDGTAVPQPQLPSSIFVEDQWVSRYTEPILWLPPEHRPSAFAVHGSIVGFGYPSGRVTVMEFAF